MEFNPLSVILTLLAGLALAGILGWIRQSRLVVFVPRLFSHSKISDLGQIVEISIMNRGFKTEEAVELSLNPHLHYELIGSNNPDAELNKARLSIPRIGSADDCSILLQVEKGKFTQDDIVSCLSKETKGVVKTKLEEIPVTAQQRVGILVFFTIAIGIGVLVFKGLDFIFESPKQNISERTNLQGWVVSEIYEDKDLYNSLTARKIIVTVGQPTIRKGVVNFPLTVENKTNEPIAFTGWISAAASQDAIEFDQRRISGKLLFSSAKNEFKLLAVIGKTSNEKQVQISFFIEGSDGETLSGNKLIRVE